MVTKLNKMAVNNWLFYIEDDCDVYLLVIFGLCK